MNDASEPPIPPQEDEPSNARNNKEMINQERKKNPNKQTISMLMERTYAFRRREILKTSVPISKLLKAYHSLNRLGLFVLLHSYIYNTSS